MDAFISRKRKNLSIDADASGPAAPAAQEDDHEDSTEFKLALLASMHPDVAQDILLEALLSSDGLVDTASALLAKDRTTSLGQSKRAKTVGHQSTLANLIHSAGGEPPLTKHLTKKGKTLFLYSPQDIETHTPCSIIHNFLPADEANALLTELLDESKTFEKEVFQLFDRTVESPHTMSFYVDSFKEAEEQKTTYVYNGSTIKDIRQTPPKMLFASAKVRQAVNNEIQRRIAQFYPNGEKLKYQDPKEWKPNTAFVNCYDGPQQSVGYHSDQLTYLGPRAVIGSLSLGVAREFRVRKIVPKDTSNDSGNSSAGDSQGQISIHLPHNSLLVMHAEMQEHWKHSIVPTTAIDPHPIAGNKRINITYRYYKPSFHPKFTPKCHCKIPVVLRCVQRKSENLGRYMWMCHAGYTPGQKGCSFFQWAEFDDDGEPPWKDKVERSETG
ncbi:GRF zinc finger domain-containing protein [Aureobasidium namibiae CBS 147.97]|uniref:GRF zinc finger domain-containing protein n=1 Tax=Aureobasidium namibiae CBS 147.97 TaxID=1043004 RepID=A0A074WJX9_9PEZI